MEHEENGSITCKAVDEVTDLRFECRFLDDLAVAKIKVLKALGKHTFQSIFTDYSHSGGPERNMCF